MSAYGYDSARREFERAVRRDKRHLQHNHNRRRYPLWQRCVAAVITAVAVWAIGEVALYVHGHGTQISKEAHSGR